MIMEGKNSTALAGNGKKPDPIVEKVRREGIFGQDVSKIDVSKPFEAVKPKPEPANKSAPPLKQNELESCLFKVLKNDDDVMYIRALLQLGADIEARNEIGETPLLYAASLGRNNHVLALIDAGADVNARDNFSNTPLLRALNHFPVMETLLSNGADINAVDRRGLTALMWAVKNHAPGMAKMLLSRGADVNMRANSGKTALTYARKSMDYIDKDDVWCDDKKKYAKASLELLVAAGGIE